MNLWEITKKNESWRILSGLELIYDNDYQRVLHMYTIMTRLKRKNNYPIVIDMIDELLNTLHKFVTTKFPDIEDEDIIFHKEKAATMITELVNMKNNLH